MNKSKQGEVSIWALVFCYGNFAQTMGIYTKLIKVDVQNASYGIGKKGSRIINSICVWKYQEHDLIMTRECRIIIFRLFRHEVVE